MIYISQCKCPHDHCILALAWEGQEQEREGRERELAEGVREAIEVKLLDPWCGLCLSREFHYTTHATVWETIEEAEPHLYEAEFQQRITAAVHGPINAAKRKAGH